MSGDSHRPSHAAPWMLGIVGVQVLYVLSAGPMEYWEVRNALGSSVRPPVWLAAIFHPAIRLCQNAPLNGVMDSYLAWWVRKGAEQS